MRKIIIFIIAVLIAGMAFNAVHAEETVKVISCEGDVKVKTPGQQEEAECQAGMDLSQGTRITTGKGSYAELAFDKDAANQVKVQESTEVVLKLSSDERIELVSGEIFTALENLEPGRTFTVKTPCATCGARGTAWSTKTDAKETMVSVVKDKVFVRGINRDGTRMKKELWIDKGFERRVKRFEGPGRLEKVSSARMARMENQLRRSAKRVPQKKLDAKKKSREMLEKKPAKKAGIEAKSKTAEAKAQRMELMKTRQDRTEKMRRMDKVNRREAIIEKRVERTDNVREQRQESVIERKDEYQQKKEIRKKLELLKKSR